MKIEMDCLHNQYQANGICNERATYLLQEDLTGYRPENTVQKSQHEREAEKV
jgi:hypothetical protein